MSKLLSFVLIAMLIAAAWGPIVVFLLSAAGMTKVEPWGAGAVGIAHILGFIFQIERRINALLMENEVSGILAWIPYLGEGIALAIVMGLVIFFGGGPCLLAAIAVLLLAAKNAYA